jgi:quinol monooxygenase YgiN
MAYVVTIKWTARRGEADAVAEAIDNLIPPTRAEPGVLLYQPHRDPHNDHVFFFYEQYVDEAAFRTHLTSEHAIEYGACVARPRLAQREFTAYETWD